MTGITLPMKNMVLVWVLATAAIKVFRVQNGNPSSQIRLIIELLGRLMYPIVTKGNRRDTKIWISSYTVVFERETSYPFLSHSESDLVKIYNKLNA